jgi:galactosamine-6-phosphate isomerase
MKFLVEDDHEAMSRRAAELILTSLRETPHPVLVAASGSTPTRAYALLAEHAHAHTEPELFRCVRVIKLDEWVGLTSEDPATCEFYLRQHLLGPLGITEDRYLAFHSNPQDPEIECDRIRRELASIGRIDLCVLGIGTNGHLGFNEPCECLHPFAHVAALSETSLKHEMLKSAQSPVRYGMTLGLAEILSSRRILLLASGAHKRTAMQALSSPLLSIQFPASFLWLHPDVVCILDRQAAGQSG